MCCFLTAFSSYCSSIGRSHHIMFLTLLMLRLSQVSLYLEICQQTSAKCWLFMWTQPDKEHLPPLFIKQSKFGPTGLKQLFDCFCHVLDFDVLSCYCLQKNTYRHVYRYTIRKIIHSKLEPNEYCIFEATAMLRVQVKSSQSLFKLPNITNQKFA